MPVPDLIGRYRLGPRLGSGGFAVVWLAHDESLDTDIAIKVMAENWADRMDLRERFLMEARMLRRAASHRIVQVFDIGELPDGRPYFVMEHADRGTLADRVREEPLPLVTALRVTAEVARGAAELHRAGIVHRDLKPSNVLIRSTPDGPERLLIADLGVAKNLAQASGVTMSVGSAGYMAPEQSGPNSGVDVRADVYSLAAIVYRLITGEVPGLPGFVRWDHTHVGLPPQVQQLLQRAMEVDRERRWPDATSFAIELDRLADQFTGPMTLASAAGPRPTRRRPGRRTAVSLAGLTVLAVAVGIGAVVYTSRQPVTVKDSTGRISLKVPRDWGKELKSAGWSPSALKLSEKEAPGLVVADRLAGWSDLTQNTNGVFVGFSADPKLPEAVQAITHTDCKDPTTASYNISSADRKARGEVWTGQIRRWDGCVGESRSVQEVYLARVDSTDRVYLQIRRYGPGAAVAFEQDEVTRQILDSLKVTAAAGE